MAGLGIESTYSHLIFYKLEAAFNKGNRLEHGRVSRNATDMLSHPD